MDPCIKNIKELDLPNIAELCTNCDGRPKLVFSFLFNDIYVFVSVPPQLSIICPTLDLHSCQLTSITLFFFSSVSEVLISSHISTTLLHFYRQSLLIVQCSHRDCGAVRGDCTACVYYVNACCSSLLVLFLGEQRLYNKIPGGTEALLSVCLLLYSHTAHHFL